MLDCSHYLYFIQANRKTYLTIYLVDHGLWSNIRVWKQCIELNVKTKITESNDRLKIRESRKETQNPKSKKILGMGLGKIKNLITSKESKFNDEVLFHSNLIFNELSRYV
jgi:hypothetical protein